MSASIRPMHRRSDESTDRAAPHPEEGSDGGARHDRLRPGSAREARLHPSARAHRDHLWHIEKRWDYWELTPDDDLITDELRDFRRRGGGSLVDLTLPASGATRSAAPPRRRTGLNIVMGTGWYREAYYPAEALIDRRSVDDLAAEMIGEFEHGLGDTGIRPGIIGEIGTDKPWVSAPRGARPSRRRPGVASDRNGDHTHGVQSPSAWRSCGSSPRRASIRRASSSVTPTRITTSTSTWPSSIAGANLQFDFLGHRFATEEALEPRLVETIVELLERGYAAGAAQPGRLPQPAAQGERRVRLRLPPAALPAHPPHGRGRGGRDPTMTIDNPARILAIP